MDTSGLLKKATEKLQEVKIKLEDDTRQLEKILKDRGVLLVNGLIEEVGKDDQAKIKKLSGEINGLRVGIEDSTPLINALKGRILSLKAKVEREKKAEDEEKQNLLEGKMSKISVQLIEVLRKSNKLNSELGKLFANWKGLSEQTGKMLFSKKIVQPSEQMLDIVCGVMVMEWEGKGGKGRTIYNRIRL